MYISALGMASNLSEAAASSNGIYSTTHEPNPMNLDTVFIYYHQKQQEHEYEKRENEYNYYNEEENYNH